MRRFGCIERKYYIFSFFFAHLCAKATNPFSKIAKRGKKTVHFKIRFVLASSDFYSGGHLEKFHHYA
jgi:hypothetical protein